LVMEMASWSMEKAASQWKGRAVSKKFSQRGEPPTSDHIGEGSSDLIVDGLGSKMRLMVASVRPC
jgi:hypothetical protein